MPDRSDRGAPAGIGLTPDLLVATFPFHLVLDEQLRIVQWGRSVPRLIPGVHRWQSVADVLTLRRPLGGWTRDGIENAGDHLHIAELIGTASLLRGQIVTLSTDPVRHAFLATPWIDGPESLDQLGLTVADFAVHDASLDLMQVVQTTRINNMDLRRLADSLARHRAQLQSANAEISARNVALERTTRELAEAQWVAGLGSWRYDRSTNLLEWSDEFGRIFGVARDAGSNRLQDWYERLHPSDRDRIIAAIDTTGEGILQTDFRIIRADGRIRYVHLRSRPDPVSPEGNILSGTLQDITWRKRNERHLRRQRRQIRKLALVAARTDNGVVITDAAGRIEWANQAFQRQSGFGASGLQGQKPGALLQVPETSPETVRLMHERLEQGQGFSVEILNASADGKRYWAALDVQPILNRRGQVTHFISVQRDITAGRRQQEVLARLRSERDMVLEFSPDGLLAFDEFGQPVYSNAVAADLIGVDPDTLAGMNEDSVDDHLAQLTQTSDDFVPARALGDATRDILALRGGAAFLERTVRSVIGSSGEVRGRVIYLHDITREKELERRRGEFLATAAHELRTPMSSIHGFSELLMTRELDVPTRREVVETIHSQSNFVVRMVNDLLDLERIASGARSGELRLQDLDLGEYLRPVVEHLMVEGDTRRVDFPNQDAGAFRVLADPDKLTQALINVLSNAFRYSRATGGPIELRLRRKNEGAKPLVGVEIRDYGIGMTGEQIQRVFDRFYRADPASGVSGTGLGMTLVREIAQRMGGDVAIVSVFGAGTQVTLWLPAIEAR